MAVKRTRNFASIVYPESAPENWQDILSECKVPAFVSPLHDQDVNPGGEAKKPHYHVLIMFEGVKTIEQALEVFRQIGAVEYLEQVQSIRGYARYLCHLDNPEKHQYSEQDVRSFCGADYAGTIGLALDKYKAIGEMQEFCDDNEIYSFAMLVRYARANNYGWYRVLCDCGAIFMREYLKSASWTDRAERVD